MRPEPFDRATGHEEADRDDAETQLSAPTMFPLRPLFVLGLAMAPFGFFANPPAWVWTLLFAPDGVRLCPPQPPERIADRRCDDPIARGDAGQDQREGTGSGGARKFSA
jgi:hypothetical protein